MGGGIVTYSLCCFILNVLVLKILVLGLDNVVVLRHDDVSGDASGAMEQSMAVFVMIIRTIAFEEIV